VVRPRFGGAGQAHATWHKTLKSEGPNPACVVPSGSDDHGRLRRLNPNDPFALKPMRNTMRRLATIGGATLAVTGAAVGYALGVLFIVAMIGGSVYRTECFRPNGVHTQGWELGDTFPYLTAAHQDCANHTLTRYVLGKIGVMSDVSK
jgi:hypothetical protein